MLARKLFVVLISVVCAGMLGGCSNWFEENTHKEWTDRDVRKIVGFFDDSLVIVRDVRHWYDVNDENGDFLDGGWGHHALYLYNYRVQEDGPRWMDSLDNGFDDDFGYFKGQMTDSVIWGSDGDVWSFWKVYDKPYKAFIKKKYDDCSIAFEVAFVKQWLGENFIARGNESLGAGGDSCNYAILDTVAGTLTYKRLDDKLKWIEKCDDVRAWGEDVYCLALLNEPMNLYLIKNDVFLDSLLQGKPYEWASYTKVGFSGSVLNLGNNIFKIIDDKLFSNGIAIRSALEYEFENGYYITY